jgi:hypothetical protein
MKTGREVWERVINMKDGRPSKDTYEKMKKDNTNTEFLTRF